MSRILPHPVLSVALALTWLLLNAPLTPGSLLLAALVGLGVPAVRCETAEDFDRAFAAAMANRGPMFIEAVI